MGAMTIFAAFVVIAPVMAVIADYFVTPHLTEKD